MSTVRNAGRPSISVPHAPPFRLVAAHFVAGAVYAAAGGGLLAAGCADLHNPLHRETLALMHLWLVGWLSLTAVGVLLQFLPVTSGVTLRSARLGWIHWSLHVSGVAGLAIAFLTGPDAAFAPVAGGVLWCGLVLAAINLGSTLLRSPQRSIWRTGALLALAHLVITPTAGWVLLAFLGARFVVQHHLALLVVHAHLGLVGWLFGLVVAVGGRLLPMFIVAPEPRPWQVAVTLGSLQCGLALLALAVAVPAAATIGAALLAGGVFWWIGVMLHGFHRRKKREPGIPLGTAWSGFTLLAFVATAGLAARFRSGLDGWGAYGLLALASGGLMVNGLLYRIVPFLVRLDRFRRLPGNPAVPDLDRFVGPVPHRLQVLVLGAGFTLALAAMLLPEAGLNLAARMTLAAGTAAFAINLTVIAFGPFRWRNLYARETGKVAPT